MTAYSLYKRIKSLFVSYFQKHKSKDLSLCDVADGFSDAYIKIDKDGSKHVFLSGDTRYGKDYVPKERRKPRQIIEYEIDGKHPKE